MRGTDDKFDTVTIHDPEKERMARQVSELKAQLASPMLRCHKAGHQDEIDALKETIHRLDDERCQLMSQLAGQRNETEKLREALEGFLKICLCRHDHTCEICIERKRVARELVKV